MKVVALAGGTGSAKLLRGLAAECRDLTVIGNVGDNIWVYGLYVCPDLDTAMYTLAGVADEVRGWGIGGDTFSTLSRLRALGEETWFQVGDRDFATSLARTAMIRRGLTLTRITLSLCRRLGVRPRLLPATDSEVETWIGTRSGWMHLQEFWVKRRGRVTPLSVRYRRSSRAKLGREVRAALETADRIVFCPGNPVTSIGPMLAVPGLRSTLRRSSARKVAISPMIGSEPISGPAGAMLVAEGFAPDSGGVARYYSGLLDVLLIEESDRRLSGAVGEAGARPVQTNIRMKTHEDERRLAREAMDA